MCTCAQDLKEEQLRAQISAVRSSLERSTGILLACSKVRLVPIFSASASAPACASEFAYSYASATLRLAAACLLTPLSRSSVRAFSCSVECSSRVSCTFHVFFAPMPAAAAAASAPPPTRTASRVVSYSPLALRELLSRRRRHEGFVLVVVLAEAEVACSLPHPNLFLSSSLHHSPPLQCPIACASER